MNLLNDKVFIGKNPPKTRATNIIWIDTSSGKRIPRQLIQNQWTRIDQGEDNKESYFICIKQLYDIEQVSELKFCIYDTTSYDHIDFSSGKVVCVGYKVKRDPFFYEIGDSNLYFDENTYVVCPKEDVLFEKLAFKYTYENGNSVDLIMQFTDFDTWEPIRIDVTDSDIVYTKLITYK